MRTAQLRVSVLFAVAILLPAASVADVVTQWNEQAGACLLEAKSLPFVGTRVMAIVHTAMFDAVNSIEGRYTPYKFKVSAPAGASPEAAGVAAAHAALVALFPDQKVTLDAAYATSLAQIPDGSGRSAGVAVGKEVAAKVLAWRASDGADAANTYRPLTTPGAYIATTLPVGSQWGNVTPWVMERGSQFHPAPPRLWAAPNGRPTTTKSKSSGPRRVHGAPATKPRRRVSGQSPARKVLIPSCGNSPALRGEA